MRGSAHVVPSQCLACGCMPIVLKPEWYQCAHQTVSLACGELCVSDLPSHTNRLSSWTGVSSNIYYGRRDNLLHKGVFE